MKKQKIYRYNKPVSKAEANAAKEKGKKVPPILCYANNEAHALQVFRERFKDEKGVSPRIDKTLIEEYVEKPKAQKKPSQESK